MIAFALYQRKVIMIEATACISIEEVNILCQKTPRVIIENVQGCKLYADNNANLILPFTDKRYEIFDLECLALKIARSLEKISSCSVITHNELDRPSQELFTKGYFIIIPTSNLNKSLFEALTGLS